MKNLILAAKSRIFDETLWMPDDPDKRRRYAYRETANWKELGKGIITYPCCPFCGRRVGQDNTNFNVGSFCDNVCYIAWRLRYRISMRELAAAIRSSIALKKININGDGI